MSAQKQFVYYKDSDPIIAGIPMKGMKGYYVWMVTGSRIDDVERATSGIMTEKGVESSSFHRPVLLRAGEYAGWFCSTGYTVNPQER